MGQTPYTCVTECASFVTEVCQVLRRSGRSRPTASARTGSVRRAVPHRAETVLLRWFAEHGRHELPWRRTRDPYAILVSEVMLQQTQVPRVVPRYLAFLARWPTVEALAAASPADVIREWQGLGYNRRGLNLHRAARQIATHGWPDDLTSLPGVGTYTAAAVARFAHGRAVLPVDVNVRRVLERTGVHFSAEAAAALMDLGATVCLARIPRCGGMPAGSALPLARQDASHPNASRGPSRAPSGSAAPGLCAPSRPVHAGWTSWTPMQSPRSPETVWCPSPTGSPTYRPERRNPTSAPEP